MVTFCPAQQYDLVTCTGDALNHIAGLEDIRKIFQNVYAYTSPGGYFIFSLPGIFLKFTTQITFVEA